MAPSAKAHLAYIDGMRGCLAVYVVLNHIILTALPGTPSVSWSAFGWTSYGRLSVDAFIVISGFCLMLPVAARGKVLNGGATQFYWKRCRRILPTFYAAAAVAALAGWLVVPAKTGTLWDVSIPVRWKSLLWTVLMCSDFEKVGRINYVFWSIAVEWRIYFAFPLVIVLLRKFGAAWFTIGLVLLTTAAAFAIGNHEAIRNSICYFGLFVVGIASVEAATSQATEFRRRQWLIASAVFGAAIVLVLSWRGVRVLGNPLLDLCVALCTAAALVGWYRSDGSRGGNVLGSRLLAGLGVFSYSLYLTHAPVIQIVWQYAIHPMRCSPTLACWLLLLIGLPASIAAAFLFFLVFERPFMSRRQQVAVQQEAFGVEAAFPDEQPAAAKRQPVPAAVAAAPTQ